jgi:cullin-5
MVLFFYRLREVGMPADYVNKLARMFQDIKVSEDLNQQFKEQYRSTKGSIAGERICAVKWIFLIN